MPVDPIQVQRIVDDLEQRFAYHAPQAGQVPRYEGVRREALTLAIFLARHCPPSRELRVAFTHLETAVFWANAAIARDE